jgi:hypothetical protein
MEAQDQKILVQAQRTIAVIGLARVIGMHGKEIEAGLATAMSGRANEIGIGIGMGENVIRTRMDGLWGIVIGAQVEIDTVIDVVRTIRVNNLNCIRQC